MSVLREKKFCHKKISHPSQQFNVGALNRKSFPFTYNLPPSYFDWNMAQAQSLGFFQGNDTRRPLPDTFTAPNTRINVPSCNNPVLNSVMETSQSNMQSSQVKDSATVCTNDSS